MPINYNTNFLCTYKSFSDSYYSNLCYQIQLLQAFNMKLYNATQLSNNINSCYKHYINNKSKRHSSIGLGYFKGNGTFGTGINGVPNYFTQQYDT